jgi:hypothetical protein
LHNRIKKGTIPKVATVEAKQLLTNSKEKAIYGWLLELSK